jgi:hypothetical protein
MLRSGASRFEVALLESRHAERRAQEPYSPPAASQMMMFIICVLLNACLLRSTILASSECFCSPAHNRKVRRRMATM